MQKVYFYVCTFVVHVIRLMRTQRKNSKCYEDYGISSGVKESVRILVCSRVVVFFLQLLSTLLLPEASTDAYKNDYNVDDSK